jgi:hypothetical protein
MGAGSKCAEASAPTNVLKLLHGTATPKRMREEVTTAQLGGPPVPPPGAAMTPEEQAVFDWYLQFATVLNHGQVDGELLAQLARCTVACREAERKVKEFGPIMRGTAETGPQEQPYSKLARRLRGEIRLIQCTLGLPPLWRMKFAEPGRVREHRPSSRDDID